MIKGSMSRFCITLFILALLTGCASSTKLQHFNKMAHPHVKNVLLVQGGNPDEYFIDIVHHPGLSFGLIGGMVAIAERSSKRNSFKIAVDANNVDLDLYQELRNEILINFQSQPMSIRSLDEPTGEKTQFLSDYKNYDCDAILDIRIVGAGYRALYATSPYKPALLVKARLVEKQTNQEIYVTTFYYGELIVNLKGLLIIAPDDKYSFTDFDELKDNADKAELGLIEAAQTIASHIVSDLQ